MRVIEDIRRDWTPAEKRQFEDVALEYLQYSKSRMQTRDGLMQWLARKHPDVASYADLVWSYVLAN